MIKVEKWLDKADYSEEERIIKHIKKHIYGILEPSDKSDHVDDEMAAWDNFFERCGRSREEFELEDLAKNSELYNLYKDKAIELTKTYDGVGLYINKLKDGTRVIESINFIQEDKLSTSVKYDEDDDDYKVSSFFYRYCDIDWIIPSALCCAENIHRFRHTKSLDENLLKKIYDTAKKYLTTEFGSLESCYGFAFAFMAGVPKKSLKYGNMERIKQLLENKCKGKSNANIQYNKQFNSYSENLTNDYLYDDYAELNSDLFDFLNYSSSNGFKKSKMKKIRKKFRNTEYKYFVTSYLNFIKGLLN